MEFQVEVQCGIHDRPGARLKLRNNVLQSASHHRPLLGSDRTSPCCRSARIALSKPVGVKHTCRAGQCCIAFRILWRSKLWPIGCNLNPVGMVNNSEGRRSAFDGWQARATAQTKQLTYLFVCTFSDRGRFGNDRSSRTRIPRCCKEQVGDRQDAERYTTVAAAPTRLGLPYFGGVECYVEFAGEEKMGEQRADAKPAQALAPASTSGQRFLSV